MPIRTDIQRHDSLYVHAPFCKAKCSYCSFYSIADNGLIDAYLKRLVEEIREKREQCGRLRSLYLGGGTPNSLSTKHLAKLLTLLRESFEFADDCEFSMEMNPASHTTEKLDVALDHDVNRFSLGIQSFSPTTRATMGRRGNVAACRNALEELASKGVDNFGCDMIFAVPGQTAGDWERDLRKLVAYRPKHVSAYSLTIEPDTPLGQAELPAVDDDLFIEQWELADTILGDANINRYEISNFAQQGYECRHNDEIWHGHPFMALGPAAHGFDGNTRWSNPDSLEAWINGDAPVADPLAPQERAVEILIIGLRTVQGWNRKDFERVTGFDALDLRRNGLHTLAAHGLLRIEDEVIAPTPRGLILGNALGDHLW